MDDLNTIFDDSILEENLNHSHRDLTFISKHLKASICRRSKHGDLLAQNSLPLTEATVDLFNDNLLKSSAKDLSVFDVEYVSRISGKVYISPCTIMLALVYIDRVKQNDPDYLCRVSSCDLFLVSMMIASKFLFDDGEDEEVFNHEWAESVNLEIKSLNKLEREFLAALDWNLYVDTRMFCDYLQNVQLSIIRNECRKRLWSGLTYEEVSLLLNDSKFLENFQFHLTEYLIKVILATAFTYTVIMISMFGVSPLIVANHGYLVQYLQPNPINLEYSLYQLPQYGNYENFTKEMFEKKRFHYNYLSLYSTNCSKEKTFKQILPIGFQSTCII